MRKIYCVVGLSALILTGCNSDSKKNYDKVFQKHQTRIDEIRKYLTGVKSSLPEAGTIAVNAGNVNPALNMADKEAANNTIVLQYHMLDQPETVYSVDSLFGLFNNPLAAEAFQWTGINKERKIFERDYLKDDEVDKIISVLSTERFPYLLVVKPTKMVPLQIKTDATFEGGNATAAFYLFDLRSKKLLSSNTFSAGPDAELSIAYKQKAGAAGQREAAKSEAKQAMQKNMRAKVYNWLKEITNNNAVVMGY